MNQKPLMSRDGQAVAKSADLKTLSPNEVHPSPANYVTKWKLKGGAEITIRPICPADEPLMVEFHRTLSGDSVHLRYLGPLKLSQRIEHQRLVRVCLNDFKHEVALIGERKRRKGCEAEILGVGRLIRADAQNKEAEFAIVVGDRCQGLGLGMQLLRRIIQIARDEGEALLVGYILPDNRHMLHICEKLHFRCIHSWGEPVAKVELDLSNNNLNEAPQN